MKRCLAVPLWVVPGALVLGLVLVVAVARAGVVWWVQHQRDHTDPLAWIEQEFRPTAEAAAALRRVHERYAPLRAAMAAELDRQRHLLVSRAASSAGEPSSFQAEAEHWNSLAARSHALTWRYVFEMSEHLPEGDGRRFREEMVRMVLGMAPARPSSPPAGEVGR